MSDEIRVAGRVDERIAHIAGRQRGRISSRQFRAAGISRDAIRRRVQRGHLFRCHHRVYAVGHSGPVALGEETAALLAVGETAALAGASAGALWGLPLTSPARTLLDLAECMTERRTELAFDRGLVDRLLTAAEVADIAARSSGRRGAAILRCLADRDHDTAATRSEAEERLLSLLRAARLPVPRVNVRLHGYEVDFHWPAHRLVVEVDGFRHHSSRRAFEHYRLKDAALTSAGISVIRITWRALTGEPFRVVAQLSTAVAQPR